MARHRGGVSSDRDMEALMIDSTVVRAHQHAAGAAKKKVKKVTKR